MKSHSSDSLKSRTERTIIQPPLLSPGSQDTSQVNAAPGEEAIEPRARETENKVIQGPSLFAEERAVKDTGDPAGGSGAPADPGR